MSNLSSNPPQRVSFRKAAEWVGKAANLDTKTALPEGRDTSKDLGCQRNEHHQMALKEKIKGTDIVSSCAIRLSKWLWLKMRQEPGRENPAVELEHHEHGFRELLREGWLEWALMSRWLKSRNEEDRNSWSHTEVACYVTSIRVRRWAAWSDWLTPAHCANNQIFN